MHTDRPFPQMPNMRSSSKVAIAYFDVKCTFCKVKYLLLTTSKCKFTFG